MFLNSTEGDSSHTQEVSKINSDINAPANSYRKGALIRVYLEFSASRIRKGEEVVFRENRRFEATVSRPRYTEYEGTYLPGP